MCFNSNFNYNFIYNIGLPGLNAERGQIGSNGIDGEPGR